MDESKSPTAGHRWAPITDLTPTDRSVQNVELPALADVWHETRKQLADRRAVEMFNERLRREWAIETGIIERIYSLDRGVTQVLIEQGIDASLIPNDATDRPPELVADIIHDQEAAIDFLFDVIKGVRPFTVGFINDLHQLMTRNQKTTTALDQFGRTMEVPLRRGAFKEQPNNPTRPDGTIHEYCPPEHAPSEMERLLQIHQQHIEKDVPLEVQSAWLHHRFTQIHPYQDGNGRIARALASLVFIRADWFPLVITRDDRTEYIAALEVADSNGLGSLVDLFARSQKRSFVAALSIAHEVSREGNRIEQQIAAISEIFSHREEISGTGFERAKETANQIWMRALRRFEDVSAQLAEAVVSPGSDRRVFVDHAKSDEPHRKKWNRWQVVRAAEQLGYTARLTDFSCWIRLCIDTEGGRSEILFSLHELGPEYRGVIAGSVSFYRRQESEEGIRQAVDLQAVSEEVFQINYKEPEQAVEERFDRWLDRSLVRGLDVWMRGE